MINEPMKELHVITVFIMLTYVICTLANYNDAVPIIRNYITDMKGRKS